MKIALTGHRPNKLGFEYDHNGPMSEYLMKQMQEIMQLYKPAHIITGMALGADTLWALTAIKLGTPFIAAVPFKGQEKAWPLASQQRYREILAKAAEVVIVCEGGYAPWKMQKRNEWMVDHCNMLISVWDGTAGGTANCVAYASKVGKLTRNISPKEFGDFRLLSR